MEMTIASAARRALLRALYKEPSCETLKWGGPRTLALPAALALRAVLPGGGPFRARWALLRPMSSTPSAGVTKLTNYLWLVESAVLGTGAGPRFALASTQPQRGVAWRVR